MFELKLTSGQVIPLRFTNWSLKRFAEIHGNLKPTEAIEKIVNAATGADGAVLLDLNTTYALLSACYENAMRYKGEQSANVSEFVVSEWVEDIGMYGDQLIGFYVYVGNSLTAQFSKLPKADEVPNE